MGVELTLVWRARGVVAPDRRWLAGRLKRVLGVVNVRGGEWAVAVVGDEEMAALHERTMGIGGTTDVLTFDLREGRPEVGSRKTGGGDREGVAVEVDTVVCVDEARRRARERGHGVREELLLYCMHSLLHVQGYDDVTAAGAAAMHAREDEVLTAIGVGAVYGKRETRNAKRKKGVGGKRGTRNARHEARRERRTAAGARATKTIGRTRGAGGGA